MVNFVLYIFSQNFNFLNFFTLCCAFFSHFEHLLHSSGAFSSHALFFYLPKFGYLIFNKGFLDLSLHPWFEWIIALTSLCCLPQFKKQYSGVPLWHSRFRICCCHCSLRWLRSLLWHEFSPGPENFHVLQAQQNKQQPQNNIRLNHVHLWLIRVKSVFVFIFLQKQTEMKFPLWLSGNKPD